MTERYSIIRKIKRLPHATPGHNLDDAFNEIKLNEISKRQILQFETNRRNESVARELVSRIPDNAVFEINRMEKINKRQQPEIFGEVTYQVKISDKNETGKKMTIQLSNGVKMKEEHPNPVAFCLETRLLTRTDNGLLVENKELTKSLYQTTAEMPQTRQTAA